jgi:hypothetical protein
MAQVRNTATGQTLNIPDDQVPFMSSQWKVVSGSAAPTPAPAPVQTQKATLYGPGGQAQVVDVGSGQASQLQSQGWGLTQNSYKATVAAPSTPTAPSVSTNWTAYRKAGQGQYEVISNGNVIGTYADPTDASNAAQAAGPYVGSFGSMSTSEISAWAASAAGQERIKNLPAAVKPPTPTAPTSSTAGVDQTGWTQAMTETYSALTDYIKTLTDQGKRVNPNVTIDQATIDKFMTQAKSELDPYYSSVFGQAQTDIQRQMQKYGEDYQAQEKNLGQEYGQALEQTQESYARRGLGFSSERDKAEQLLADRAQSGLSSLQQNATRQAEEYGSAAASTFGSRNLPSSFNFNTGAAPIQKKPGVYGFSTSNTPTSLFKMPNSVVGTQERQRLFDEKNRVNELTSNERQLRGLYTQ